MEWETVATDEERQYLMKEALVVNDPDSGTNRNGTPTWEIRIKFQD